MGSKDRVETSHARNKNSGEKERLDAQIPSYLDISRLSLPIAGVQLATVALTSTDVAMLGTLSVVAIGAGGLAMQFYNQIRTMCVGMVTASGNKVAEAVAKLENAEARGAIDDSRRDVLKAGISKQVRVSFEVATVISALGAIIVALLGASLFVLPVHGDTARIAFGMTVALAPGLVPMLWLNVLRQYAVGMRKPGSLLVVTLWSIAVNAAVNWLMVTVAPTTAWAVAGIGLSTTVVQVFTLVAFSLKVRKDPDLGDYVEFRPQTGDMTAARELLRIGWPVSLTYGSEAALTTIAGIPMSMVSPTMLAAHTVVNQIAYIVYQVCIGFSHGSSILVSRGLQANHPRVVITETVRRVAILVGIYLGVIGLVWATCGRWVFRIFAWKATDEVMTVAIILMFFAILQQFAKGSQNVAVGLLRGLRDTSSGLKATLIGYWCVGIPALFILGLGLRWEAYGVWLGLILGFGTTTLLLMRVLRRRVRALPATQNSSL